MGHARKWLWQTIASRPGLMQTLHALGYRKGHRLFTSAQVEAIVKGIGGP